MIKTVGNITFDIDKLKQDLKEDKDFVDSRLILFINEHKNTIQAEEWDLLLEKYCWKYVTGWHLVAMLLLANIDPIDTMSNIPEYMFKDCDWLLEINIPSNIKRINYMAFNKASNLTTVSDMSGVKQIDEFALNVGIRNISINYNGTKEEFMSINREKTSFFNAKIHCSDGDIIIFQTQIKSELSDDEFDDLKDLGL